MQLRKATIKDTEELAKVKQAVWKTTYQNIYEDDKINNFDYTKHKEKFRKIISDSNQNIIVVCDEGDIVGYCVFGESLHPYNNEPYELNALYILKDYQGQGLGRQMINYVNKRFKELGIVKYLINCNTHNTNAIDFYKAMGVYEIGREEQSSDKENHQAHFIMDLF